MSTSKPSAKIFVLMLFLGFMLLNTIQTKAQTQNAAITNVQISLKKGNAQELVKSFNTMVELSFNGEKSNYSKTQAEFVLKDFFKNNPPTDFQYIHQGSSKEGLVYAIGKYTFNGGTYRVYILIKQFKGIYLVDTLDFSKE